jgi:hypothetical protein
MVDRRKVSSLEVSCDRRDWDRAESVSFGTYIDYLPWRNETGSSICARPHGVPVVPCGYDAMVSPYMRIVVYTDMKVINGNG